MDALTSLIQEDATQSMPPFDMWLAGRDDILTWWFGPGIGCRGSRVIPAPSANGSPTFGQYKPSPDGGHEPWALQVLRLEAGGSSSSRSSSTPRRCSRSSASHRVSTRSTPASPANAISSSSSRERVAQASVEAEASRGELEPRERVQRGRIGGERAHVDDDRARMGRPSDKRPSGHPELIGAATDEFRRRAPV